MKSITTAALILGLALTSVSCQHSQTETPTSTATPDPNNLPVYDIPYSATSTLDKADKKVLILSASPRRGGNTDLLCDEFAKGAQEAGGKVEKLFLDDYKIDFFHEEHSINPDTVIKPGDQAPMLVKKMAEADIIVLSSPVYYMNIDGQLKTLMDRCYRNSDLAGKEFYYITACADREESTAETGAAA